MLWQELTQQSTTLRIPRHQLFQEEMQKTILTFLSQNAAFNNIVFQGGTSLRFFYGNPRFSEDLDFVKRQGKQHQYDLQTPLSGIENFIKAIFPFIDRVAVHTQKHTTKLQRIIITAQSEHKEQRLRVHIELASVPSYHNQPKILQHPPLQPAVRVEDMEEILADKIIALAQRPYLKGRDIWDIYFLTMEKQVTVSWNLVRRKAKDYEIPTSSIKEKLSNASKNLQSNGVANLMIEMKRFLPTALLEQYSESFPTIVKHVTSLIYQGYPSG